MALDRIQLVEIPKPCTKLLGQVAPKTRMYHRSGTREEFPGWFEAAWEVCGPEGGVSPGVVGQYADVSRAGVHKRMKEEGLTAFLFHLTGGKESLQVDEDLAKMAGRPYTIIPLAECRQWAALLQSRRRTKKHKAETAFQGLQVADNGEDSWRQW